MNGTHLMRYWFYRGSAPRPARGIVVHGYGIRGADPYRAVRRLRRIFRACASGTRTAAVTGCRARAAPCEHGQCRQLGRTTFRASSSTRGIG